MVNEQIIKKSDITKQIYIYIYIFNNPLKALDALKRGQQGPNRNILVLLDINMPEMKGLSFWRRFPNLYSVGIILN